MRQYSFQITSFFFKEKINNTVSKISQRINNKRKRIGNTSNSVNESVNTQQKENTFFQCDTEMEYGSDHNKTVFQNISTMSRPGSSNKMQRF